MANSRVSDFSAYRALNPGGPVYAKPDLVPNLRFLTCLSTVAGKKFTCSLTTIRDGHPSQVANSLQPRWTEMAPKEKGGIVTRNTDNHPNHQVIYKN